MPDTFLAVQICKTFEGFKNLAKDKVSRELYRYTGTHWEHIEEDYLLDKLTRICCQQMHCSLGKIHSVFGAILRKSGTKPERKAGLIAVRNGVYSTKERCFLEHSKKHGNCGFIDVDYSPDATECPTFDLFINSLSNGSKERKAIILAVIYYHIANKYDAKMFTEIVGEGDTGKTTLNKFICILVGNENVAHLDLRNVEGSKRSTHALEGVDRKAMISYAEMESARGEFQTTKSISGGEDVMLNPKNKRQYSTRIRATQMFTGNQPIEVIDKGSAMLNRRVVVVLTKEFKGKDKDKQILKKLTKEIPAIINKLINYMTEEKFNSIIETAFLSADKSSVLYKTDAIYRFISESLIVTNDIADFAETGNRAEYNKATDKTKLSRAKRKLYECYLLWHETQEDLKGVKDFTLNAFKELLLNWLRKAFYLEKHFDFRKGTNNIRGLPGVTINTKCPHLAECTEEVRRNHTYESIRTE
jgi:putative DNA primase/helicase